MTYSAHFLYSYSSYFSFSAVYNQANLSSFKHWTVQHCISSGPLQIRIFNDYIQKTLWSWQKIRPVNSGQVSSQQLRTQRTESAKKWHSFLLSHKQLTYKASIFIWSTVLAEQSLSSERFLWKKKKLASSLLNTWNNTIICD